METSGTVPRSIFRIIMTGLVIAIIITAMVVLIINLTDYQKVKNDKPIDKKRAGTMYYFNLVMILGLVLILLYAFYMMYKELFPAQLQMIKNAAQQRVNDVRYQAAQVVGPSTGYVPTQRRNIPQEVELEPM